MRILTLKEIAALDAGEVVPALKAQVKEVKEPKSGENTYGPWTMQSLTVMDATAVSQVKLFDAPVYDVNWIGVWIVIESTPNQHGKLSGIQVSEYNKRKEIQVKMKAGATISQVTDATPEPTAQAPEPAKAPAPVRPATAQAIAPAPVRQPQSAPEPAKTAPAPGQGPKKAIAGTTDEIRAAIANVKGRLGQSANGLILCFDAALYIANEVTAKHSEVTIPLFGPEQIEKLAISLWISLERSGLAAGLPAGPLSAWQKAKPEPPPVEPEPEDNVQF